MAKAAYEGLLGQFARWKDALVMVARIDKSMSSASKTIKAVPLKNGVQSILVGFTILEVMASCHRELMLKEISEVTGLSPSKVHSYLVSFCSIGMATQNTTTGGYQLGSLALKLGLSYLENHDVFSFAKPIMMKLADEVGQTAFLGVWGNRGPTILNRVDGANSRAIFDLRIGSVLPVIQSALGRNFAAHLPFSIVEPYLIKELENAGQASQSRGMDDLATMSRVRTLLRGIADQGISRCRGGLFSDFTAISAPVFDHSKSIICAITIMGPIERLDDDFDGEPVTLLKAACQKISESCGYQLAANPDGAEA
jgi:DNA-binding IclR family transcriptional regulator